MKDSNLLDEKDIFCVIEVGAGDGTLAFDLLNYCLLQSSRTREWRSFYNALKYIIIDRSPYLLSIQLKKNWKFRHLLHFLEADITGPFSRLKPWSGVKGIVIANEVVDNFPHHRLFADNKGNFCVSLLKPYLNVNLSRHLHILNYVSQKGSLSKYIPLDKEEYLRLCTKLATLNDHQMHSLVNNNIQWQEAWTYLENIPQLCEFVQKYFINMRELQKCIKESNPLYVSPDYLTYLENINRLLSKGFIFTIDYGGTEDFFLDYSVENMRIYGKTKMLFNMIGENDITFDVNFRVLNEIGKGIGLNSVYYGPQRQLADYHDINLRRYKKAIVENHLSNSLLKFYTDVLTNKRADRKNRMKEVHKVLKIREELNSYNFNTYLLSLIKNATTRSEWGKKKANYNMDQIEEIFQETEDIVEESVCEFYEESYFQLLIQRKECNNLSIYL